MLVKPVEIATKARLTELLAEGLDVDGIAQALGLTRRGVERAMVRHDLRQLARQNLKPEERMRMLVLDADGLLPCWIAEDIGRSAHTVGKHLGPNPDRNKEWQRVWQQIRRNPVLLELHREIAPKPKSAKAMAA